MTYVLSKTSRPRWTREFECEREALSELRRHVCSLCMNGEVWVKDDSALAGMKLKSRDPIDQDSAAALLATCCGQEFDMHQEA